MAEIKQREQPWRALLSRLRHLAVGLGLLAVVGLVGMPLQRPIWAELREARPALAISELEESLGQGILVGVFGGFRTLMADITYLRAMHAWEQKDRAQTEALLTLTTRIDPRPLYFWLNGARAIALDIPVWRIRERGGELGMPPSLQQQIRAEQGRKGIQMLEAAQRYHPESPELFTEKGLFYMGRLEDPLSAAREFLKAWEAGGHYFNARIHGAMLRKAGRPERALAFFRQHYYELPADDPAAAPNAIIERIRELENELEIPVDERFRPVRAPVPNDAGIKGVNGGE